MIEKLKPCPFCGGQNLETQDCCDDDGDFIVVRCTDCKAEGPATYGSDSAGSAWNKRKGANP